MKAMMFTRSAFSIARAFPARWWIGEVTGAEQSTPNELRRYADSNFVAYATPACDPLSSLIVIGCPEIFQVPEFDAETAVQRIAKLLRAGMDNGRLPPEYGPYRHGTKASAFAYTYNVNTKRVVTEARPLESDDFFVCSLGSLEAWDLSKYIPDYDLYRAAVAFTRSNLPAVNRRPASTNVSLDSVYTSAGGEIGLKITWETWYSRQVNYQQKEFIDLPFNGPIRLRGGPGTGKTLTLALKALKTLDDAKKANEGCRILFLTHSWSLAEAVDDLLGELDPGSTLRQPGRSIEVWPLLTLADQGVVIGRASRRLLGPDSRAGKLEMFRRIEVHLEDYLQGNWVARKTGCRASFAKQIEASVESADRKFFVWDVLNEIATVFAAAGLHPRKRAEYLRLPRRKWMMDLETGAEKEVVADIYAAYFNGLLADGLTGPEQLISDYLRSLSTFEWERMRRIEGFDCVLVDEMHLFDEQERFVLHQLLADADVSPPVAMAIDPKQSAVDVFVSVNSAGIDSADLYKRANLPSPTKLDLTEAFRHTQSIAKFVQGLLEQNMHLGLGDEWDTPAAQVNPDAEPGECPTYTVHAGRAEQFRHCFDRAKQLARQGEKRRVAVICMDADRFDDYRISVSAQFSDSAVVVSSQEDMIDALRYRSRRFALSLPEYVSGLQFDSVLVIDVNDDETSEETNQFQRRRFLTDLYVACSRAKVHLELHATEDRGGLSDLLRKPIAQGSIAEALSLT